MIVFVLLAIAIIVVFVALSWYRVVPPSEAHFVVSPGKTMVCSSDAKIMTDLVTGKPLAAKSHYGGRWYFKIPVLRTVRRMDITIKELVKPMETYEKDQGRYNVKYSIKFRIRNVERAAETFVNDNELYQQLDEVVQAAVRAITVKYSVVDARANKRTMGEEIEGEITDDLEKWGLELVNFVLVDFQDTGESKIISDISRRREVEINSETRQLNANRIQEARVKEAEAEQKARQREIEKDEAVAKREEDKKKAIAVQAKEAKDKELDVVRIEQVKSAEIAKERARVEAEQKLAVEEIIKKQKKLEGEGDRDRDMERAKGMAAPIKEKGLAEAEAKEALQKALNKFGDAAIRALVAEQIVGMQKEVGVKAAEALKEADVRIFAGGDASKSGFDVGQLISSMTVSNESSAQAILNRLARPNDLGISLGGVQETIAAPAKKQRGQGSA